uniref:Uncharacterized protein n=1 Tax=Anas zonorhyncha TaxID=75864 RepID=A0A8B9V2N7_9AVES
MSPMLTSSGHPEHMPAAGTVQGRWGGRGEPRSRCPCARRSPPCSRTTNASSPCRAALRVTTTATSRKSKRCRASCGAGCAAGSGRPSSRTTSGPPTPTACARGTRWCSACWRPRPSTCSSCTSWSTTSCGPCGWQPAPRSPPSRTTMSAASSSTGGRQPGGASSEGMGQGALGEAPGSQGRVLGCSPEPAAGLWAMQSLGGGVLGRYLR